MKTNKSGYTKNSTGTLVIQPNLKAYSYDWYCLGMKHGDDYIINNYSYSNTTIKHVYKLRSFIKDKGLNVVTIEAPRGLQNLEVSLEHYKQLMQNVTTEMNKPRKREATKQRLMTELHDLEKKYNFVLGLIQNKKKSPKVFQEYADKYSITNARSTK